MAVLLLNMFVKSADIDQRPNTNWSNYTFRWALTNYSHDTDNAYNDYGGSGR